MSLSGKRILLGVTGSIAAYKSALLVRLLIKAGAEVQVIMSTSALDFITPLTLATLSKRPVLSQFWEKETGEWSNHVELGLWADLFVIAPLSANTLGKMANGICDNLLLATYLSARCPVMVCPAMDLDMYQHPAVKTNLNRLILFGNSVLEATSGELASGLVGQGRMAEPESICQEIEFFFNRKKDFLGKRVLITLGPTQENIDPVRFISNHSSGKMGFEIAKAFQHAGAIVSVVAGPVHLDLSQFTTHRVTSANEMFEVANRLHSEQDICVFAAAVADYAPAEIAKEKIKKLDSEAVIHLKKNPDIALELGRKKKSNQLHIGFALETEQEERYALEKLHKKNLDWIVLNSARDEGAGFKVDTNKVSIFHSSGRVTHSAVIPKSEVAQMILNEIKLG